MDFERLQKIEEECEDGQKRAFLVFKTPEAESPSDIIVWVVRGGDSVLQDVKVAQMRGLEVIEAGLLDPKGVALASILEGINSALLIGMLGDALTDILRKVLQSKNIFPGVGLD